MADDAPLGVLSTVTALGETQLPPPRPAAQLERPTPSGGRYTIIGTLGRGGMGIVDRVWDGDLMRELAAKRIRPEHRDDPQLVAQFLWEARIGAHLDHPNIVPVHDLGANAEGPFFTMKRASGRTLAEWLAELAPSSDPAAQERFPLAKRLRVMHQICQAIAFAHRRGVLHRDLKPANVIVGDNGEVLVTDWGLALPVPGPTGDELRAVMPEGLGELSAGTPQYMSPEQARGDSLDERSDVYTLGVMLFEVAAGVRPFTASSMSELSAQRDHAPPVRAAWPEAPSPLVAVIERAMAAAPAARYASAGALADDLERVLDGGTPEAEHASPAVRLARYYMTTDRAMSTMRVVDIDMWAAGSWLVGVAIGAVFASYIGSWWWIGFVLGAIAGGPPTWRYFSARRAQRHRS